MVATDDALLTRDEAKCWLLYHRSPGLSQSEIAEEMGLNQGTISRLLAVANPKVEQLKRLLDEAGGDSSVVEKYLMRVEITRPNRSLRA